MASKAANAVGHGLFGLGLGVILFSFFYFVTARFQISQRFEWSWVGIYLVVLLGPAVALALYGFSRPAQSAPGA